MATALRISDARFLLPLLLPFGTLLNALADPGSAALWAAGVWVTVAAVDAFWPGAQTSPPAGAEHPLLAWAIRLFVPLQAALLVAGLVAASRASWAQVAGLAFAIGFVTGAQGITYAHELGHSRNRIDRALGWFLMGSVGYGHFMVEHYRGHHPRAATADDPATARYGESLWRFLPRTLAGSFVHAWELEAARVRQFNASWVRSPLVLCVAANVLFAGALALAGQGRMLAFWLGQAAFAVWLLETVNYIEHYGLNRAGSGGTREPFAVAHAWNADHVLSNSLLANLQRHSDHHMHAWKRFPALEPLPGPRLPTGYAGCLLLAAVPPLWFRVMHRRFPAAAAAGLQAVPHPAAP